MEKTAKGIQEQFKKILKRRLENSHIISAILSGGLQDCYKIKLRKPGYRLVYQVKGIKMKFMMRLKSGKVRGVTES